MCPISGWHELVGGPGVGKTTLAALLSKEIGFTLWMATPQEVTLPVLGAVGHDNETCVVCVVEKVRQAFDLARSLQRHVACVVLDSLASLEPDHPGATTIAKSVERHLFMPRVPILVINQDRYPFPPGGSRWASVVTRRRLTLYRQQPFLLSYLDDGRWLIWNEGGPRLGKLSASEKLFVSEEVLDEVDGFGRRSR